MTDTWMVVPTRGDRPETLARLIAAAAADGIHTVVVWTGSPNPDPTWLIGHDDPMVTYVYPYYQEVNIQAWWNQGIMYAHRAGARAVLVVNDDVEADPGALRALAAPILGGAALTYVTPPWQPRVTPITGYAFGLSPVELRLNAAYAWWWGEHDLELRARAEGLPVVAVETRIRHLRTDGHYPAELRDTIRALIDRDRELFARQWPDAEIRRLLP